MANLFDNQFKKNPLSTTPAVGNATFNVVSGGIGGGKQPPVVNNPKDRVITQTSQAGQSLWFPPEVTGLSKPSSNVVNITPTYVPSHPITGIPGFPGYTGSTGRAPVINTRTGQAIDPRTGKPVSNSAIDEITPRVPTNVYNPPTSTPPSYPSSPPTSYPSGSPTSYPSGGDLNQLSQTMAMMVAPQQSQNVVIAGDRSQLLPFQADRAFRGKDPGISQQKNRNYLDMLRAGFSS
jgi:hypothetical protein